MTPSGLGTYIIFLIIAINNNTMLMHNYVNRQWKPNDSELKSKPARFFSAKSWIKCVRLVAYTVFAFNTSAVFALCICIIERQKQSHAA